MHRTSIHALSGRGRRGGSSLVEITVVMVVLTVAMGMFTSTVASTARAASAQRETALAAEGARQMLETLRADGFRDLFALYNADHGDDPLGPGTAQGPHFAIEGLAPREGDPDGRVAEIVLPISGGEVREDVASALLSLPRDLDGDGLVDGADHSGDYVLLPVQVRVEWRGAAGDRSLDLFTALFEP